jgi:hypothetical protein
MSVGTERDLENQAVLYELQRILSIETVFPEVDDLS